MGNYEQLKQSVSDVIKTNGNKEITGSILQNVLLTIISTVGANATFVGIATPATNPGTPDGPVFYLASENGTYSNFGSIELQDGLSVLMWNGSWSSQQIFDIDDVPTAGSDNLVKSGGVLKTLDWLNQELSKTGNFIEANTITTTIQGFYFNSQKWIALAGSTTKIMSLADNDVFSLYVEAQTNMNSAFVFLQSLNVVDNESLDFVPGTEYVYVPQGTSKELLIPYGTKYIAITNYIGGSNYSPKESLFYSYKNVNASLNSILKAYVDENEEKIDLTQYDKINFNLENGQTWASSSEYQSVLIPISSLKTSILKFFSITYKCSYCFLKDNVTIDSTAPNICDNQRVKTVGIGESASYELIPADANYLYVYISNGNFFGKFGIARTMSINEDIEPALFIKAEVTYKTIANGVYYNGNTNKWVSYAGSTLKYIEVLKSSVSKIELYAQLSRACYVLFLDSITNIADGNTPDFTTNQEECYRRVAAGTNELYEIPIGTKYIIISNSIGNDDYSPYNIACFKSISKKTYDIDVSGRNKEALDFIRAAKFYFNTQNYGWTGLNNKNLFVLAQLTDIHSDTLRASNFVKFVNENNGLIDDSIVTGDYVSVPSDDEIASIKDILKDSVFVVGNHDKAAGSVVLSESQIKTKFGQSNLYYYKDYPDANIRIICLNQYDIENGSVSIASATEHFSQTQIDWFVNTLEDAVTNNYNVIVAMHSTEVNITPNENGFYQRFYSWQGILTLNVCSGTPIADIINAFRNGDSLSEIYSYSDIADTITVEHNFQNRGKFVCYLCGHLHGDFIGYSSKYSDQLYLSAPVGAFISNKNLDYSTAPLDLPRYEGDKTEDCFNVYAFDTIHKTVKIVRVGSCINDGLEERKRLVLDY